jgi:hypothetical protein
MTRPATQDEVDRPSEQVLDHRRDQSVESAAASGRRRSHAESDPKSRIRALKVGRELPDGAPRVCPRRPGQGDDVFAPPCSRRRPRPTIAARPSTCPGRPRDARSLALTPPPMLLVGKPP